MMLRFFEKIIEAEKSILQYLESLKSSSQTSNENETVTVVLIGSFEIYQNSFIYKLSQEISKDFNPHYPPILKDSFDVTIDKIQFRIIYDCSFEWVVTSKKRPTDINAIIYLDKLVFDYEDRFQYLVDAGIGACNIHDTLASLKLLKKKGVVENIPPCIVFEGDSPVKFLKKLYESLKEAQNFKAKANLFRDGSLKGTLFDSQRISTDLTDLIANTVEDNRMANFKHILS